MSATPLHLFQEGNLAGAIAAMNQQVKEKPTDIAVRSQLAELLCVSGDLERAERMFEAIAQQDPKTALQVGSLRQLLRASMARKQVFREGRAPELLATPPEHVTLRLEALVQLRAGQSAEASASLARAEDLRPQISGKHDDVAFSDFRDLDDLLAGILEVMTTTGKYYWVPMEQVEALEFDAPKRMLDTAWRMAQISVRGGPQGEVAIPAIYPQRVEAPVADAVLLGRETNWDEVASECVLGEGLRTFLVGDESLTLLQLRRLEFDTK
ncbi:hypothetical protein GCM10007301_16790 [Azorhizobium oxalatiphilum]|uniref:SciE type virulence protein n=1 Tax=Azorhizobium oxalatiphilum TaxID=980631 RepID=A0A917BT43_9HYPH|nr:type VI secretion system accessory protein TagJ [Azorhizobium oxalatiphilum]GGF57721.1 hypothetical protein GCM10007301_16790 [Azorhizobium oxalatiphilum]